MDELSETQFSFIKKLCESHVYLMVIPLLRDDDTEEAKNNHNGNFKDIQHIIDLGFLEDISEKFADAQSEAIERTGRGFTAYMLTVQAIQMFDPRVQSGGVN